MQYKHMSLAIAAVAAIAALAGAPEAFADHRSYRAPVVGEGYGYDRQHRHHRHGGHGRYMPRWLKRHDHFQHWYRYTPLKYNRGLTWGELYSIFKWERRYSKHRRYHRYHDRGQRKFGYYRDYWHRGPRHKGRHYDRYGDRRHDKRGKRDRKHDRRRH